VLSVFLFFTHAIIAFLGSELVLAVSLLRKIVALIGLFFCLAVELFIFQLELVGLVLIVVYVGAIAVLFLFVVMLYSANSLVVVSRQVFGLFVFLISVLVIFVTFTLLDGFLEYSFLAEDGGVYCMLGQVGFVEIVSGVVFGNNFTVGLGKVLWTEYLLVVFMTTILLLVGIIGSVGLTRGMVTANFRKRSLLNYKGALTNKPFSYKYRAWELTGLKTYDLFDTMLQPVLVEVRGLEIMRILPAESRMPNFPWISDKTRFFFDGLLYQRISDPLVGSRAGWMYVSLVRALVLGDAMIRRFMCNQFNILNFPSLGKVYSGFTPFSDLREKWAIKDWCGKLGGGDLSGGLAVSGERFVGFSSFLDLTEIRLGSFNRGVVLLVGVDLRFEIPRLHLIYRYFIAKGKLRVYGVGLRSLGLSKYNVRHIGITTESIVEIVEGRHRWLNVLRNFNYDKLTLLWGRGFRGWLYRNSKVLSLVYCWAKLYKAELVTLYSDINTFGSWFSGISSSTDQFEYALEGNNLVVSNRSYLDQDQATLYPSRAVRDPDFVFASFEEELPRNKRSLVFPVPTLLEQESLAVGLEGLVKKTTVITSLPGSLGGQITQIRTVRRILSILGKGGFGGLLSAGKFSGVVRKTIGVWYVDSSFGSFYSNSYGSDRFIRICAKVSFMLPRCYVKNFFQTDPLTRNSKLLFFAAQSFYKNICLYD